MGRASNGLVVAATAANEVGDVAGDLDVVVGELAELGVIETEVLVIDVDTEAETGDEVHEEEDQAGQDERPDETGDGTSKLVAELDVVVLDPATIDDQGTIERSNVGTAFC